MDRDLWKREMLDSINILLDQRGDPREEPLWDSLQLAVDSLGAETVDMSGVKACLNQHTALLVHLFTKPPRRARERARKYGHKFATPSSEGAETAETDDGKKSRKRKPNPARIARIQAYARVQEAFRSDRKRCAGMVLEGKWGLETATLGLEEQEAFWRPLLEASSRPDERPVLKVQEDWSIVL